jgi:hypothetical protein
LAALDLVPKLRLAIRSPKLRCRTYRGGPRGGSPAIDKGDNNAVDPTTQKLPTTDQRGAGLAVVDIGAFEL